MLIKSNFARLTVIFILVILFPIVQNQWLNLYLFDKNNFTIYRILYYLSGLILPVFVCINSFKNFTFYKFINIKRKNNFRFSGKSLLLIILISLILLSNLIVNYIFINIKLFFKIIILENNNFLNIGTDKYILLAVLFSILLCFNKIKFFIKKALLINFFVISIMIWYSKINNVLLNDPLPINNFLKFENVNSINIFFLFLIEISYFLWSYISHGSHLSDWSIPKPSKDDLLPFLDIMLFYLMIFLYYLMLSN